MKVVELYRGYSSANEVMMKIVQFNVNKKLCEAITKTVIYKVIHNNSFNLKIPKT